MVRAKPSTKSEVARSSECTEQYAQKVFDNADIVRDAIFRQQSTPALLLLMMQIVSH